MQLRTITTAVATVAFMAMTPTVASAQDNANTVDTSYGNPQVEEDDDDFPWGLLGLLGLAGLLGRKRQERDIHVDARKH